MEAVERVLHYIGTLPNQQDSWAPAAGTPPGESPDWDSPGGVSPHALVPPPPSHLRIKTALEQGVAAGGAAAAGAAAGGAAAAIEFLDVYMRYRPGAPYVLRGLSLRVEKGQRLGVCGRTGAGKSSLVNVLMRLAEIQQGSVLVRGKDLHGLGLQQLRAGYGVVPQEPVLFQGSVRDNLDPFGLSSDRRLAQALEAVRVWGALAGRAAELLPASADAAEPAGGRAPSAAGPSAVREVLQLQLSGRGGVELSDGQRQLLCMARMLLRGADIVLLDECTASVDADSARVMAAVLREQLGSSTVLQIAHDLGHLEGYDVVAVMEGGRVVEAGPPGELLQLEGGAFAALSAAGTAAMHV
jgi:ABC-type multidrug transport system fused ATPase/permease subunit